MNSPTESLARRLDWKTWFFWVAVCAAGPILWAVTATALGILTVDIRNFSVFRTVPRWKAPRQKQAIRVGEVVRTLSRVPTSGWKEMGEGSR